MGRMIQCNETSTVFMSIIEAARWLSTVDGRLPSRPITNHSGLYIDLVKHLNKRKQVDNARIRSIYGYSFTPLEPPHVLIKSKHDRGDK